MEQEVKLFLYKYDFKYWLIPLCIFVLTGLINPSLWSQNTRTLEWGNYTFEVPKEYFVERENIPDFWISSVKGVSELIYTTVRKGRIEIIGSSAGNRPIRAITYGEPRIGKGTTTFSGSLGYRNIQAYRGPDHDKTVYMAMASVHGGEFEGIVGIVNLISVLETGKDLRGKAWPEIREIADQLDRIILIPIMNPDGRARLPLRMETYNGTDETVHEYLNTGGFPDGSLVGWPEVKEYIPLDFDKPVFPGGYPNDAGVNIQHDDFLGDRQPETQSLFNLVKRERPDLILNLHTGALYLKLHRPFSEPILEPVFDSLYTSVQSALALAGLQSTMDTKLEGDFSHAPNSVFNIDGALNLHCGALSITVESPSHSFSGRKKNGEIAFLSPEMLLDSQLICHLEAMRFLVKTGGRSKWTPGK